MFWEEPRVPGLPGAEDVTDGSVDGIVIKSGV